MPQTIERPAPRNSLESEPEPEPATGTRPSLDGIRRQIQDVDRSLVELIARRCSLARAAGECKVDSRLPLLDPAQEAAVVRRSAVQARQAGIAEEGVRRIFWALIELSRDSQRDPSADGGPESPGGHGELRP
jgi:chorismate mutase